jgi:hypothetical protein
MLDCDRAHARLVPMDRRARSPLAVSLPMLSRCVFTVWGAWLGAIGLATVLTASGIWNSPSILPVGLSALMLAGGLGLVVAATVRLIRGPRRGRALAALLVGTAPFWFLAGHILMAIRPAIDRHVAPGWPTKVFSPLAMPIADLEARWFYPERTRGKWVTMVGAPAKDARAQAAAMDRHVEATLARLNQSSAWPIFWYRGRLFGMQWCAVHDMAIGSEDGLYQRGADGLTERDRHEVAHCVINRNCTARSDPPRVLMEGWAQANQGTPAEELAWNAWDDRRKGRSMTLRRLVARDWYWYSGPAAYTQGAPIVNYLLRVYGPQRFLKLYATCQQATFEADCRATLGIGLDELDAAYWADTEQIVRRAGPPTRLSLKSLKIDPGIDPAAWDAFLADYFAAVKRLFAPYDHVRLTTVFRAYRDGQDAQPWNEQRQELLRSGPLARVRLTDKRDDLAYLAGPDRSLEARRSFRSPDEPWTIREVPRSSLKQSYRRACNGGMVLLRYPQEPKLAGFSTDYEVVELKSTTSGGHRLVTLRLRTSPEVKVHREDCTFVFDADEMFVVRSERADSWDGSFEGRYGYDRQGGRPVSQVITWTNVGSTPPKLATRLEVTECRFGPIPESEFAEEPFLARLHAGEIIREQVEEPPAGAVLEWYWLAFVVGGISLAGGSGLALGSRDRDRQAQWSD